MTSPKTIDYFLLTTLALIWASAFFNIKIATYSYGPITIAFLRILFGMIPVVILCFVNSTSCDRTSRPRLVRSRALSKRTSRRSSRMRAAPQDVGRARLLPTHLTYSQPPHAQSMTLRRAAKTSSFGLVPSVYEMRSA